MTTHPSASPVVDEIETFNQGRRPKLLKLKYKRMRATPFAFFRGADHLFAGQWARLGPPDPGPAIRICGDLHLENFGAYRDDDGRFLYDIDDFDEALVAPCSLDLVRCCASIMLAAQDWKFTPVQAMRTLLGFIDHYRSAVIRAVKTGATGELALHTARGPIWGLLKKPGAGDRAQSLARFTEPDGAGPTRLERRSGRFRDIGHKRFDLVRAAVEDHGKPPGAPSIYEVLDVAFRIAGTGSLGLERYAVLVRDLSAGGRERLLDIKEARPSALLPCVPDVIQPDAGASDALRVVISQRLLQSRPTALLDVLSISGRDYRLRELIPEENQMGLDRLKTRPRRLRQAVSLAGRLTAWAHVRGSRVLDDDRSPALREWASGPGLDSVIASSIRFADRTRRDHKAFCRHPIKIADSRSN